MAKIRLYFPCKNISCHHYYVIFSSVSQSQSGVHEETSQNTEAHQLTCHSTPVSISDPSHPTLPGYHGSSPTTVQA